MREGFEFNALGEAQAFMIRMEDVARPTFNGGTSAYSKLFKHPTLNKWGYEIEANGSEAWSAMYIDLNPNDINNLITFTSDWFPDTTI